TPPSLTAPPTPMDPADRATWNARAYAFFVTWLANTFYAQLVAAVANVWNNATEALTNATAALGSQVAAQAAAATAQASAGAALWSVATVYTQGQAAISAVNFNTYRRTTAGSGGVDPALDTGGTWVNTGQPPVTMIDLSADTTLAVGMV